MVLSLLQTVPPQQQQMFMDGVVEVNQMAEQFAASVYSQRIRQNGDLSWLNAQAQEQLRAQGWINICNLGPSPCIVVRRAF